MSIIVSVKINDGIVMAADSALAFFYPTGGAGQIYQHATKIMNLVKGLPIGVMTCGSGSVGAASVDTLLKDLRGRLSAGGEDALDPGTYTLASVAGAVGRFFSEKAAAADFKLFLLLRVCGYSSGEDLPEVWQVGVGGGASDEPICAQQREEIGPRWNGELDAMDRLLLGIPPHLVDSLVKEGLLAPGGSDLAIPRLVPHVSVPMILPAAPIQDAIDLARFMVETTIGFIRFAIDRPKTVGGAVEIASITKHEGFKWVQRKHFYPRDLNVA